MNSALDKIHHNFQSLVSPKKYSCKSFQWFLKKVLSLDIYVWGIIEGRINH